MDTSLRSRLAQLSRLLLSSTHPGEVFATAGAINRTLATAGLDLHAFAGLIDDSRARHPLDDDDDDVGWRDKVVYASVHTALLNDWERGFIDNMLGWDGMPTSKQSDRINIIYNKIKSKTTKQ